MVLHHHFVIEKVADVVWAHIVDAVQLELYLLGLVLVIIVHFLVYVVLKESAVDIPSKIPPYPFHLEHLQLLSLRLHLLLLLNVQRVNQIHLLGSLLPILMVLIHEHPFPGKELFSDPARIKLFNLLIVLEVIRVILKALDS